MKWHTLRSQINVIINRNLQQHAEMEFEKLHMNGAAVWHTYLTYTHVNN